MIGKSLEDNKLKYLLFISNTNEKFQMQYGAVKSVKLFKIAKHLSIVQERWLYHSRKDKYGLKSYV